MLHPFIVRISRNPRIIDTIRACRYTQRVLLVFLSLLVFLLSLVAVAVQFGRDAGIFKQAPGCGDSAVRSCDSKSGSSSNNETRSELTLCFCTERTAGDGWAAGPIAGTRL